MPEINKSSNKQPISELKNTIDVITESAEKMSKIAEKGPSNLLMTLGGLIIIFALLSKIEFVGVKFTSLAPIEFIFILITGWLFLGGASLIKYIEYRDKNNIKKMLWEGSQKQVETISKQHKSTVNALFNDSNSGL